MRRIFEILICAVVCMIGLHTFAIMGLVAPVQVSAGSMAPHWLGPHWDLVCGECGAKYEVGADAPPQAGRTVCPVCGETVLIGDAPRQGGDSLLVDRAAFLFRSPRRWEAVVFRCPNDARRLCFKRVVGLPGERVSLIDGDVYVNGRIVRKSLNQQRAMRVVVYRDWGASSRWQPTARPSSWTLHANPLPSFSFDPDEAKRLKRPLDLLAYKPPNSQPSSDALPYNAGVRVIDNATPDLMVTGAFSVTGGGALLIRCGDGESAHWVELNMADASIRILQADRIVYEVACPQLRRAQIGGRAFAIELSLFDRQVIVALDGNQCLQYALEAPIAPSNTPFAMAARNLEVRMEDLTVWRDVVYTPRPGGSVTRDAAEATWQLAADEYFVLGDNPAISDDSRTWRHAAGLPANLIVGRAIGGR